MNHRNLAKIHSALGDTHTALKHNLTSIELESNLRHPNTTAYRRAAVQIIATGGDRGEAQRLIDAARHIEGKVTTLPTSERTHEIINKIQQQQKDRLKLIELEKEKERRKQEESTNEWKKILAGYI